eukprot:GHVT01076534.1.p1 GENE.GHVT01076534.1~~GHVT01076534.1.p1  ORF type:complete len:744 (+),score=172.34 GHVT01076534.1:726-2957(+)
MTFPTPWPRFPNHSSSVNPSSSSRSSPSASCSPPSLRSASRRALLFRGCRFPTGTSFPCVASLPRMVWMFWLFLGFALAGRLATCQIRVSSPASLRADLISVGAIKQSEDFVLLGSTSTYGAPVFGTEISGQAFYVPDPPPFSGLFSAGSSSPSSASSSSSASSEGVSLANVHSHCSNGYCVELQRQIAAWRGGSAGGELALERKYVRAGGAAADDGPEASEDVQGANGGLFNAIVVVDRGQCTFVKKLAVAQSCGACAVVVVDSSAEGWTREMIRQFVMLDDGHGDMIKIPSVLVSYQDGQIIKAAILKHQQDPENQPPVLLQMEWNLPINWPIVVDFWGDLGAKETLQFLSSFSEYAISFGFHVFFKSHFFLFELDGHDDSLCLKDGIYANQDIANKFCAFDPKSPTKALTGRVVVAEALRQLCLQHVSLAHDPSVPRSGFSLPYWEYLKRMGHPQEGCSFLNKSLANQIGPECSTRLVKSVLPSALFPQWIDCVTGSVGLSLLQHSKLQRVPGHLGLRINGARFPGHLDANVVAHSICSSLENSNRQPIECSSIVKKAMIEEESAALSTYLDWSSFVLLFLFLSVVSLGLTYLFYYYKENKLKVQINREMQEEISRQLAHYSRLPEGATHSAPRPGRLTVYSASGVSPQRAERREEELGGELQTPYQPGGRRTFEPPHATPTLLQPNLTNHRNALDNEENYYHSPTPLQREQQLQTNADAIFNTPNAQQTPPRQQDRLII